MGRTKAGDMIARHNDLRSEWFETTLTVLLPVGETDAIDGRTLMSWRAESYRGRRQQNVEPREETNAFGQQALVSAEFFIEKAAPMKTPPADVAAGEYSQPPRIREDDIDYEVVHAQDGKTGRWVVAATQANDRISESKITS